MTFPQRLPCVCYEWPHVSAVVYALWTYFQLRMYNNLFFFFFWSLDTHLASTQAGQPVGIPLPPQSAGRRAGMHSPPPRRALVRDFSGTYESLPARSIQVGSTFG